MSCGCLLCCDLLFLFLFGNYFILWFPNVDMYITILWKFAFVISNCTYYYKNKHIQWKTIQQQHISIWQQPTSRNTRSRNCICWWYSLPYCIYMMKLFLLRLIQTRLMMKLYPKNQQFQQPYSKTPKLSKNKWEVELHNTDNNSLHPALQNVNE